MACSRSVPRLLVGLMASAAWSWPVGNHTLPSDSNFASMMTEQQDALSLPHIAARGSPVSCTTRARARRRYPSWPHNRPFALRSQNVARGAAAGLMQPQTPLGLLDSTFDPLRQTRRGTRLALGEACTADSHCMSHVCRCPSTYRRRPEFCTETGKVCTELLPVGAECDDNRRACRAPPACHCPPASHGPCRPSRRRAAQPLPSQEMHLAQMLLRKGPLESRAVRSGPKEMLLLELGLLGVRRLDGGGDVAE